jgi:hypothetical protein
MAFKAMRKNVKKIHTLYIRTNNSLGSIIA